jgi:hypothetical protein
MRFEQPNNLARALQVLLNDVVGGKTLSLSFSNEEDVRKVLETLDEVARAQAVTVLVRPIGRRTLELTLANK